MKKLITLLLLLSCNCFGLSLDLTGISNEKLQEFISYAEKKWPNDYCMQAACIQNQVGGYQDMNQIKESLTKFKNENK